MRRVIEVTLDERGNILIPAEVRDPLGLSPGMTLVAEEADEGAVRLRVHPESPQLVDKGGVLVVRTGPLDDQEEIVRREREQRVEELLKRTGL